MSKSDNYFFYCNTGIGNTIKVLVDILVAIKGRAYIKLCPSGIDIKHADENVSVWSGTLLQKEYFRSFKCLETWLISINLAHTQKLLKNVKKKDSMEIYILKGSDKLTFRISSVSDEQNQHETLNVAYNREEKNPNDYDVPGDDEYNEPIIVDSSKFQKIKKMLASSREINIIIQNNNYIKFSIDAGGAFDADLEIGTLQEDKDVWVFDEQDLPSDISAKDLINDPMYYNNDIYKKAFYAKQLTYFTRLSGICSQLLFYAPKSHDNPIMIKLTICQKVVLGSMKILIKDVNLLMAEEEEIKRVEESAMVIRHETTNRSRKRR